MARKGWTTFFLDLGFVLFPKRRVGQCSAERTLPLRDSGSDSFRKIQEGSYRKSEVGDGSLMIVE
jgi:hypothetical protein